MRAIDVFTPNSMPTVTKVSDHLVRNVELVNDELARGSSLISLIGPSKSGKTVFIEGIIGKDYIISISGAGVNDSTTLWNRVLSIIGAPLSMSQSSSRAHELNINLSAGGSIPTIATVEGSGGYSHSRTKETEQIIAHDIIDTVTKELRGSDFVIFIDDFHYISRGVQSEVAAQIKNLIQNGVKIICASVPYRSDDVLRANPDLRGRFLKLDFNYWNPETLIIIANKGFSELNIHVSDEMIRRMTNECFGSPQLMQAICLNFCLEVNHRTKTDRQVRLDSDIEEIGFRNSCQRTALANDYTSLVDKLLEGPKTRGSPRTAYTLKDRTNKDVYPIVIKSIASDPPRSNIRYPDLIDRIRRICLNEFPSGSSVTGACAHISTIANTSSANTVIEWDSENDVIDIRDPYLMFFLRWRDRNQ